MKKPLIVVSGRKKISIASCALLLVLFSAQLSWGHHEGPNAGAGGDPYSPANVVSLTPISYEVARGSILAVNVSIDFTDLLLGGSFHLGYDPAVIDVLSFSFAPSDTPPMVANFNQSFDGAFITWGWFDQAPQFSISGMHLIGTLILVGNELGLVTLTTSAVPAGVGAGPLAGPGAPESPLTGIPLTNVTYESTYFYVVPEPSTGLLLLLGLFLLLPLRSARESEAN